MNKKRSRLIYSTLTFLVIILGLASRRYSNGLPEWVNSYLGDILWALMIFLILGVIFNKRSTRQVALMALIFSFSIELSQLYHAQWIDEIRRTRVGGLVLGFGFLWKDLLSYTVGITIGCFIGDYQ